MVVVFLERGGGRKRWSIGREIDGIIEGSKDERYLPST